MTVSSRVGRRIRKFLKEVRVLLRHLLPLFRRLQYLIYKIFYKRVIVDVCDSRMCLDLTDKGIAKDLFVYRIRETAATQFLLKSNVLEKGDIVLDIGANIGYYILMESKLVGKFGKIYAVEPVLNNLKFLKENVALNNLKNVKLFRVAMGCSNRKTLVYISERSNMCSLRKESVNDIIDEETVDMITVDSFLESKDLPNFVRMDVEGYEYNIIKGAKKLLSTNVKILMEVHGCYMSSSQAEEMFSILKQHNFRSTIIVGYLNPYNPLYLPTLSLKRLLEYFSLEAEGLGSFRLINVEMVKLQKWLTRNQTVLHVLFSKSGDI